MLRIPKALELAASKTSLDQNRRGVVWSRPLFENAPGLSDVGLRVVGGFALILGLLARISALGIAVNMLAAIVMMHGKYGLFMNWFGDRKGHGIQYHLLAIALAIVIIAKGAGAFPLDGLLFTLIGA